MSMRSLAFMSSARGFLLLAALWCLPDTVQGAEGDRDASTRRSRDHFIAGMTLQVQGNRHAEAILEFQQALRYDSAGTTMAAIGRSYLALRKYELANEYATAATVREPTVAAHWELLAEVLIEAGEYDKAVAAYEHLRDLGATRRQLIILARLYEPRSAQNAASIYEQLVAEAPDGILFERLLELYHRLRRTDDERRTLERLLAVDPGNDARAAELGAIYASRREWSQTLRHVMTWSPTAIPTEGQINVWMQTMLAVQGSDSTVLADDRDSIMVLVDRAYERCQRVWPLMTLCGSLALRLDDTLRAGRCFDAAIVGGMSSAEPPLEIAAAWFTVERWQRGFDVLSRTAPFHSHDARFPYLMGMACVNMGADSAAVVLFRHTTQLEPAFVDAWIQLGVLYESLGDMPAADSAYRRALAIDPDNHVANNNFAYSLASRGTDLALARQCAWRALQQFPTSPSYLDTYAWVLYSIGEFDAARTYVERAIARGGNATHYEHYGDILLALGQFDGALAAWTKALDLDPDREPVRMKLLQYR